MNFPAHCPQSCPQFPEEYPSSISIVTSTLKGAAIMQLSPGRKATKRRGSQSGRVIDVETNNCNNNNGINNDEQ